MAKVKYREGDWFGVSLRDSGFAVGLVARANPGGVLLGYFFGRLRSEVPALDDVAGLQPADAVLVRKFGHLGIVQGKWPLLGRLDGWDRRQWPTPVFVRYEELTGRSFRVFYDDDDPNRVSSSRTRSANLRADPIVRARNWWYAKKFDQNPPTI